MTTKASIIIILLLAVASCQKKESDDTSNHYPHEMENAGNLLKFMSDKDLHGFRWMNTPLGFEFKNGSLFINPGDKTDFFNDPASDAAVGTAPMLYKVMKGDFVATALAKPNFKDVWNACALMVHVDSLNWGKFCFENSDATGVSIVSVVTKDRSDDSNGPMLNEYSEVWMKVARKGNLFGFYWSLNGKEYKMARLFSLPDSLNVKMGMVAQCPAGKNVGHEFSYFSMEERTIEDMRKGK